LEPTSSAAHGKVFRNKFVIVSSYWAGVQECRSTAVKSVVWREYKQRGVRGWLQNRRVKLHPNSIVCPEEDYRQAVVWDDYMYSAEMLDSCGTQELEARVRHHKH
jgi:hypothetical protein